MSTPAFSPAPPHPPADTRPPAQAVPSTPATAPAPAPVPVPPAATPLQPSSHPQSVPSYSKEAQGSEPDVPHLNNGNSVDEVPVVLVQPWKNWWYIIQVCAITSMLIWPWIFFGIVYHRGGIAMEKRLGSIVHKHPSDVTWVVTLISNLFTLTVGFLYSNSVKTLAVKWIISKETEIFFLSFISAVKSPTGGLSWLWTSRGFIRRQLRRLRHAAILVLYAVMFLLINSAFNTLLTPQPITRTAPLQSSELDFSADDPDCVEWYKNNMINYEDCSWQTWEGLMYTTCLNEDQMVDVLQSGRNNMFPGAQSNNTATYEQLYNLRVEGPVRGVLPIGTNGVPGFDTLGESPLSDGTVDYADSYNYTLDAQGVSLEVSCVYATESPIAFTVNGSEIANALDIAYVGTCPSTAEIVLNDPYYPYNPPNYVNFIDQSYPNMLLYWACYTPNGDTPGYILYFRGFGDYDPYIVNTTCSVSPAHAAVYPVNYTSNGGSFIIGDPAELSSTVTNEFINSSIWGLGSLVNEAQSESFNSFMETVITAAYKNYDYTNKTGSPEFLSILEGMIQGVLEYEATYVRLIYSMYNSAALGNPGAAPASCMRPITGSVSYEVSGWYVTWHTALYLIPLTLVNLTSLGILIYASFFVGEWQTLPRFNPLDPIELLVAGSRGDLDFSGRNDEDVPDVRFTYDNSAKSPTLRNSFRKSQG